VALGDLNHAVQDYGRAADLGQPLVVGGFQQGQGVGSRVAGVLRV